MTDAWHEARQALRALRKSGDIRSRLIEAYRALVKIKAKDLPREVRHDHEWLVRSIDMRSTERLCGEIRHRVTLMTPAQMSEAVHRIVALHDGLRAYQPTILPTPQKQAACRALRSKEGLVEQAAMDCVDCTQCELF